jgi:DNA-binding SARP family transcriptional activator/tetratricopeptide (TPR) repeat protein/DNA-binding Xre family transcriptional regulator
LSGTPVTEQMASRVRMLRLERRWSARQLAEACAQHGAPSLSRANIAKIESGIRKSIRPEEIAVLAKVLDVSPGDLLASGAGAAGASTAAVAGMPYALLGDLEIGWRGEAVKLPAGPTLIVLAALLINANRRVSKADLIRAAWDGEVAEAQLHKRVKDVRDLLKSFGRGEDMVTHAGFGYEIRVAEDDVDTLLFQRLVRDADEAGVDHRTEDEIGCLQRALKLWRGPHPLANVPGEAFRHERMALEQRPRRAAVRLFELELARGNHEHVLDQLIRLAAWYPSDRRLCEQLMLAAYRSGYPADAAQVYERYRDVVAEETGGDPDALLRTLHFAIAGGDTKAIESAQSAIEQRNGTIRLRSVVSAPHQLPPPVDLVGRGDLEAEVAWLLRREPRQAAPVVVVSGPGGIGKTALALAAAHACADRYPDGQLFAELHGGAADTGEVLAQFLRAFGMARVPEAKAERLAAFRTLLAERRVLVVLDDAGGGTQVDDLLPASPLCAVLVTARRRLPEVRGVHHVAPLEPLNRPDATDLFLRVVRGGGINAEDDPDAVGRVVRLCGGLPLALRIAGALRVHDDPQPAAELADRLSGQGLEAFAYEGLSVARVIGAGFERLQPVARKLLLGLGLLPVTAFGRWTVAALLEADDADAASALTQLAASFMIEPVPAEMRYRFHDLTREYARRRAQAEYPGDADVVFEHVYRALLTLVRRAHIGLYGGDFEIVHSTIEGWDAPHEALAEVDASPLEWFERERANIRAAVEHCAALGLTETCWDLAVSAHEFYGISGYFDDWQATHTVALRACRDAGDRRGEAIVLACLNQPALVFSRRSEGGSDLADLERAVELFTESRDAHGQAIAMRTLANALRRQGHLTRPLALFNEALSSYATSGDTVGQWQTLRFIGQTHLDRGDFADARRVLEESGHLAVELGGGRLVAQTRYWIGQTCLAAGDVDEAQVAFDAVLDVFGVGGGIGRAYALHGLGQAAARQGTYGLAERYLIEAAELAHQADDSFLEGRVWLSVAGLRRAEKQADEEIIALERTVSVFAGCGAAYLEIRALARLARAMAERGDATVADAARIRIDELYSVASIPEQDRLYRGFVRE